MVIALLSDTPLTGSLLNIAFEEPIDRTLGSTSFVFRRVTDTIRQFPLPFAYQYYQPIQSSLALTLPLSFLQKQALDSAGNWLQQLSARPDRGGPPNS